MTRQERSQRTTSNGGPLQAPAINVREKQRRKAKRQYTDDQALMDLDEVAAIVYAPATYQVAARFPVRQTGQAGRPAHYPIWTYMVYAQLISVYGSARKVHAAMRNAIIWDLILRGATAMLDLDAEAIAALPTQGPKRHHWNYWSKEIHAHLEDFKGTFRACAAQQAKDQGMLNTGDPFNLANPLRRNTVVGDGKVHDGPSRYHEAVEHNPDTGEVIATHRVDNASALYKEGGVESGKWVYGSKWVTLSCRADDTWHDRVILDVEHQFTDGRGEAGLGVAMIERLKQTAPGLQHAVWDGAMRGVHIERLLNQDVSLTAPIHAYRSETGRSHVKKGRSLKDRRLGVWTYTGNGSRCRHDLVLINGRVHESNRTEDGSLHVRALAYTAERRPGKTSTRWYHVIRVECPNGDKHAKGTCFHEERIPLTRQPEDQAKNFNRAENLRVVPSCTELFDLLIGWRQDSESFHSQAEYAFHGHRLPAYHPPQQTLVLLGLALRMNAVSRYVHAGHHVRGAAPPGDAPAAAAA